MDEDKNFPTMIIPSGTEIAVNDQGQLSIRTPGNLVIQNSGVYSVIESGRGSVRIDPTVKVEAVSVQAADSCYVAGELTAWRVKAKKITLEKGAQANIMLQESETLELDRAARLVGNFASEKELYLMLGRFTRQLRHLPDALGAGEEPAKIAARGRAGTPPRPAAAHEPFPEGLAASVGAPSGPAAKPHRTPAPEDGPFVSPNGEEEAGSGQLQQRQEVVSLVRVIVERELGRPGLKDAGRAALQKLLELVRAENVHELRNSARYLLSQVEQPSEDLEKARGMLDRLLKA